MPTKITLTPKQKAALEDSSRRAIYCTHGLAAGPYHHYQAVSILRYYGYLSISGISAFRITGKGLQWLADDAQPAVVKQEPEALPEHITSRLPEGYMS